MATARQKRPIARTRKKCTGPKSKAGRQSSAQNAVRHGLSSQNPDPILSLNFYRCILQDPLATPQQAYTNQIKAAALALAQREAILLKVQNALTAHDQQIAMHMVRISKDGINTEQEAALAQAIAVLGIPVGYAKKPDHWIFNHIRIKGDLSILEPLRARSTRDANCYATARRQRRRGAKRFTPGLRRAKKQALTGGARMTLMPLRWNSRRLNWDYKSRNKVNFYPWLQFTQQAI